jgi:hypothetical protein
VSTGHRRFTKAHPCPICDGHDGLARGQSRRCFGYLDESGIYARCTREERGGGLRQNRDGTYSHRLQGRCRCGQSHGVSAVDAANARQKARRRTTPQSFRSFFTLAAFLRRMYGQGSAVTAWAYHGADGREAFRVLRIDHQDGDGANAKTYRPCHQAADGRWRLSKPGGLLPLYNLPAVLAAPPGGIIAVLEGEKCADLATAMGLTHATTSAHGAKAPWLSDWSPLAGRRVAILPDEGEDGAGYATQVGAILAALVPPASVAAVSFPGLADGEDIEEWIARRRDGGRQDSAILAELHALITSGWAAG